MEQMDSNGICYQVSYLQSDDIVLLILKPEVSDS